MKVSKPGLRMFDLDASNSKICPSLELIVSQVERKIVFGEACVPPGGARLVTFHCQRFGCPSHEQRWSDSHGRIDKQNHRHCCIAKHP